MFILNDVYIKRKIVRSVIKYMNSLSIYTSKAELIDDYYYETGVTLNGKHYTVYIEYNKHIINNTYVATKGSKSTEINLLPGVEPRVIPQGYDRIWRKLDDHNMRRVYV